MKLPGLGDAITEGTVVNWHKSVGEMVAVDDVVAVVETDKVVVDIKADISGVLVERFVQEEETIEVGANLLKLDTEAVATAPSTSVDSAPIKSTPAMTPAKAPPPPMSVQKKAYAHKPLIKFLGKRSLLRQPAAPQPMFGGFAVATGVAWPEIEHSPGVKTFDEVPRGAFFGRPSLAEEEAEAISLGIVED